MISLVPKLHPITRKRWQRFREMKRAWWSLRMLLVLYGLSLFSELLCNNFPLYVRANGQSFFPAFRDLLPFGNAVYTERKLFGTGGDSFIDFNSITNPGVKIIFAPVRFGPNQTLDTAQIPTSDLLSVTFQPPQKVGTVNLDAAMIIARPQEAGNLFGTTDDKLDGLAITNFVPMPATVADAVSTRLANKESSAVSGTANAKGGAEIEISLSAFSPRSAPPKSIRVTLRGVSTQTEKMKVHTDGRIEGNPVPLWNALSETQRVAVFSAIKTGAPEAPEVVANGHSYSIAMEKEAVRFPFRPCTGHPLGIDDSGRDVLARLVYGMRISVSFGIILVIVAMLVGTILGGLQGYFVGLVDLTGQRLTEIWSAIPFLYVIIIMGSIFGRSFLLLILCDALFGWIHISYYMRAEFLRLRKLPFVEAAQTLGLRRRRIMFGHILPNALVPLITFFPFYLVGNIGLLSALDYLGYGLPVPTPSWGEMLSQGHTYVWAWWLVLYPALALFVVMLLCVFIGEGVRAAFDPKKFSRME